MAINRVSGNLEYDLAVAIEKFETQSPIAARLIQMLNSKPSSVEMIHIYVGTIDALFTTILNNQREIRQLKDALTHPLVLDALKKDADDKRAAREKKAAEYEKKNIDLDSNPSEV